MQTLDRLLPHQAWVLLALAGLLCVVTLMALLLARRRKAEFHKTVQARLQRHRTSWVNERRHAEARPEGRLLFDNLGQGAGSSSRVVRCRAELVERRPLSEAQWDSPVPAAWTIFRLQLQGEDEGALQPDFQLGLLLPVQHAQAYSAGYMERLEATGVERLLQAFSVALSGPVPGPAIAGSATGFLEFKTYLENAKPEVVPGSLDLSAADYWIFAKLYVQDTMEMYLRLNPGLSVAEFVSPHPEHGEELMRVLAATLRPTD